MSSLASELLMCLQDKVALLAWNGRFVSAPEDGGRVYCLSEKAGEREMIQVRHSYFNSLSSERELSPSVCHLSVILVHSTQTVEIFHNSPTALGSLAIH